MRKCVVCKKALSPSEGVVLERNESQKEICTCSHHVKQGQALMALIKDLAFVFDEKEQFLVAWNILKPTIENFGLEKVRWYLEEQKDYWCGYLQKKDFSNIQGKATYFKKVLETNLATYEEKVEKVYEKQHIDDGSNIQTVIPKRKKKKSLNTILKGAADKHE